MLWAIDADGRLALSSGCHGDSGGPVYSGTDRRPRLLGVISWAAPVAAPITCPSVSAEVGPLPRLRARAQTRLGTAADRPGPISGDARAGGALTCTPPAYDAPVDAVTFQWRDRDFAVVATGPSYTVQPRDSGPRHLLPGDRHHSRRPHNHHGQRDDRALTPTACLRRPRLSDAMPRWDGIRGAALD